MEAHAIKYSMGYRAKKGYTFWEKDFDAMAYKTMLRQLISKWGIMSIELQSAIDSDMAVINDDGTKDYVENDQDNVIDMEQPQPEPEQSQEQQENEPNSAANDVQAALFGNK